MENSAKNRYLLKNKNIYLLFGDEKYLIKEAYDEIIKNVVAEENKNMNVDYFIGKDVVVDRVIDAMFTYSFFADNRCIVVKDSGLFKKGNGNESLIEALTEVPDTSYLLFVDDEVDKTNGLYKQVNKLGAVYEMKTLKENELVGWTENLVKSKNIKINRDVVIHILRTVDLDMVTINNEVEKLTAYVKNKGIIEKSDVDLICKKSLQTEIFKLMDAIGNKEVQTSLEIYNDMIYAKEPVMRILTMVARQIKIILLCKELDQKGVSLNEMSDSIGVHSFVIKGCVKQSKNFSKKQLLDALLECSNLETRIKSGKVKDVVGLETLIVSLF